MSELGLAAGRTAVSTREGDGPGVDIILVGAAARVKWGEARMTTALIGPRPRWLRAAWRPHGLWARVG